MGNVSTGQLYDARVFMGPDRAPVMAAAAAFVEFLRDAHLFEAKVVVVRGPGGTCEAHVDLSDWHDTPFGPGFDVLMAALGVTIED
jgi:hypothetical protein